MSLPPLSKAQPPAVSLSAVGNSRGTKDTASEDDSMFAVAQSVVAAAHRPVLPHQGRTTQTEPRPLRATKPAPRAVRAAATDDAAGEASGTSYYKIIDGVKYDRKVNPGDPKP